MNTPVSARAAQARLGEMVYAANSGTITYVGGTKNYAGFVSQVFDPVTENLRVVGMRSTGYRGWILHLEGPAGDIYGTNEANTCVFATFEEAAEKTREMLAVGAQ